MGGVSMKESHLFLLRTCSKAAGAFTAWLTDWRTVRNHASELPSTTSPTFSGFPNFLSTSGWGGYPPGTTLSPGIRRAPSMLSYSHGSQMR